MKSIEELEEEITQAVDGDTKKKILEALQSQRRWIIELCEEMKKDMSKYNELLDGEDLISRTDKVFEMNRNAGFNSALRDVICKLIKESEKN